MPARLSVALERAFNEMIARRVFYSSCPAKIAAELSATVNLSILGELLNLRIARHPPMIDGKTPTELPPSHNRPP